MNTAVFCFSDRGAELAVRLCGLLELPRSAVHSTGKFAGRYGFTAHEDLRADMGALFQENRLLLFLCACGIAVRYIAPHLAGKASDPAVLVMDDGGRFVIPILSGHLGGANAAARKIAVLTGAQPVVTTATDGAGRFSCDAWAVEHNCALSSLAAAKAVSAAVLAGDVPVSSEFPLPDELPGGLFRGSSGELGIYIGVHKKEPYGTTLRLIPRVLRLGIGCRRGTGPEEIAGAVRLALDSAGLDMAAVSALASIDLKKEEPGLLAFARSRDLPLLFYSAGELAHLEGSFTESDFVKQTVSVGNVCERAAVMGGGKLIVPKTARNGVTVAIAALDWSVEF